MNKIIEENNKNTYRWEFPTGSNKVDSVYPELVVQEADEELESIGDRARVALGRKDE